MSAGRQILWSVAGRLLDARFSRFALSQRWDTDDLAERDVRNVKFRATEGETIPDAFAYNSRT